MQPSQTPVAYPCLYANFFFFRNLFRRFPLNRAESVHYPGGDKHFRVAASVVAQPGSLDSRIGGEPQDKKFQQT